MAKSGFKKKIKIVGIVIFVLAATFFIGLQIMLRGFSKEIAKVSINNINLANIEDGDYTGEFNFNEAVGAKVEVTVKNNRIINIEILEHKTGMGSKAEAITNSVLDAQSLEVDFISGATGSSTVILKAIENALEEK